ncbi:MAG: aminotransferase class I/II-fold pyridoxal phosphate-dependent enzyme, partial [Bacteroidota bacterium]
DELAALAEVIAKHDDLLVVSDEIYEHIVFDGVHDSIAQHPAVTDRTIVVNGMSKGFAMTGWRLGYMAAPAPIAKACAKIQGQCTSGATAFGQRAAMIALQADPEVTQDMMRTFLKRRDLMIERLQKIQGLQLSIPEGAFYIFPDCSNFFGKSYKNKIIHTSDDLAEAILKGANVATVSGAAFGAPNCLRISYAASEDILLEACSRLETFFGELV